MAQLNLGGLAQAALAILGGFALLAINHFSVIHQRVLYTKAVYGGPMIMMVGLFALFEPRIMTRHLPMGKSYPKSVLILTLLAMAIGAFLGWQLSTMYH